MQILTPRLNLRLLVDRDASDFSDAVSNSRARLSLWLPWAEKMNLADAEIYIQKMQSQSSAKIGFALGLRSRSSQEFWGELGIHHIDWDRLSFELGYWLSNSALGKGIATEAAEAVCSYLFAKFAAEEILILCDQKNQASQRIPRALGFKLIETRANDSVDVGGMPRTTLVYRMLKENFHSSLLPQISFPD